MLDSTNYTNELKTFSEFYKSLRYRNAKTLFRKLMCEELDIVSTTLQYKISDPRNFSKLEIEKLPLVRERFLELAKINQIKLS